MYAVIRTGGKQYRVEKGTRVRVEKLSGSVGEEIKLDDVLLIGGTSDIKVGTPRVSGASVTAKILEQDRAAKVLVYKVKKRKKYRKTIGHRQPFTCIEITGISTGA